jgi:WD40 repeat protein
LASAGNDKTIHLGDIATGKTRSILRGHNDEVRSVAFSPDGKTLASGGRETQIRLWDVASTKEIELFQTHKGVVYSAAFAADGKTLASGGQDGTIRLWDTTSGKQIGTYSCGSGYVYDVLHSPDGKRLVSMSSDGAVRVWQMESGKVKHVLRKAGKNPRAVAFSPADGILATAFDETICLWDVDAGKEIRGWRTNQDKEMFTRYHLVTMGRLWLRGVEIRFGCGT